MGLTKKEILLQLKALGINSSSDLSFYYEEYRQYYETTLQQYYGYVFNKENFYLERAHQRIPASIKIRYVHQHLGFKKILYTGTIKNISEKGMFISTRNYFPSNSKIEICIPTKKNLLGIYVKNKFICIPANIIDIVWKRACTDGSFEGIGIELSKPMQCYLDFVGSLKSNPPVGSLQRTGYGG